MPISGAIENWQRVLWIARITPATPQCLPASEWIVGHRETAPKRVLESRCSRGQYRYRNGLPETYFGASQSTDWALFGNLTPNSPTSGMAIHAARRHANSQPQRNARCYSVERDSLYA